MPLPKARRCFQLLRALDPPAVSAVGGSFFEWLSAARGPRPPAWRFAIGLDDNDLGKNARYRLLEPNTAESIIFAPADPACADRHGLPDGLGATVRAKAYGSAVVSLA